MKRFYWFLFAVCLLSRRFRLKGKRRGITVGRWRGISLSMRSFVSEFLQFTLATPHLKGCPLRESIIGAAAGGIGHPRLAIGIWMSVWVEPWDFMTLTIRVFARCGRLLRFRLSFQKCPDLFGGRLPSCDRSCDRRWTWRLLWSRILEFRIVRQIPFWNYEWSLYILNSRLSRNGYSINLWTRTVLKTNKR